MDDRVDITDEILSEEESEGTKIQLFIEGVVEPGEQKTLSVPVPEACILQSMMASQEVAGRFVAKEIRADKEPVLMTNSYISLAIFVQESTHPFFKPAFCREAFSIDVVNTTKEQQPFKIEVSALLANS